MTDHLFRHEFGRTFAMPREVIELLTSGELIDVSWHNDTAPSFEHRDAHTKDGSEPYELRLWVDYENPADREAPEAEGHRFAVYDHYNAREYYSGDDIAAAIRILRDTVSTLRHLGPPR